jgi:hypothetical protein
MKLHFFSQQKKALHDQKGFALLLAVIVAGVLLSVTYLMFSINLKQISLSTTGANSQYALFAADTGVECALYADQQINYNDGNIFAVVATDQTTLQTTLSVRGGGVSVNCNNRASTVTTSSGGTVRGVSYGATKSTTSKFQVNSFTYPNPDRSCALVTVTKYIDDTTQFVHTYIQSRGYNSGDATCKGTDPQRVERGLEVYY